MSGASPPDPVRRLAALPLQYGTPVAIAMIVTGLLAGIADPVDLQRERLPLVEVVAAGGAPAVTAIGLLLLCLVPLAMALAAAVAFAQRGEPRYLASSVLVAVLLAASLLVPALLMSP